MEMTKTFDFTATQFIWYLETVRKEMATAQTAVREFMIEYAETEFRRAAPEEYKKYCDMIGAGQPCN